MLAATLWLLQAGAIAAWAPSQEFDGAAAEERGAGGDGFNDAEGDQNEADDDEEGEDKVPQYMEELFLGTVMYPQDQGEVQLTYGFFKGNEGVSDSLQFAEIEYGITDRLQLGFEVPVENDLDESFDGVRELGVELYYNCYNDPRSGRAFGAGFEVGAPVDSPEGEPRAMVYEPFFVAYQDFGGWAGNFSAAVEIEDPVSGDEETETGGELAAAIFGPVGCVVPMLECRVEIEGSDTPVRLAPGLYVPTAVGILDLAVSLPVGLTPEAPEFGVFVLAVVEFGGDGD